MKYKYTFYFHMDMCYWKHTIMQTLAEPLFDLKNAYLMICIGYSELRCVLWWYSFTCNTHSSYPFHVPYHAQLQTHTHHIPFHHYSTTILEILCKDSLKFDLMIFPDKPPNFGNCGTEIDSCEIQTKFITPGVLYMNPKALISHIQKN